MNSCLFFLQSKPHAGGVSFSTILVSICTCILCTFTERKRSHENDDEKPAPKKQVGITIIINSIL